MTHDTVVGLDLTQRHIPSNGRGNPQPLPGTCARLQHGDLNFPGVIPARKS